MLDEKIVTTEEFRLRLTDLGYQDNLSDEQLIQQIKQMYIEEYGEQIPSDIEIFGSDQSLKLADDKSGYDGTALHFYSKENNINEVYIISQGTQDMVDWEYNLKAMFAGLDYTQAEMTNDFVIDAAEKFNIDPKDESIPVIGLSHSLAHNNNTTAHLVFDTFDQVYSVNGAQTNYYEVYNADAKFARDVRKHFSIPINDYMAIYDINPKELEKFALNYYADKAENIHQLISKDDPLYAVSGLRGFFTLGEVEMYDTNPDFPGLREIMDDIPDHVVKDFQDLAIQYTISAKKGGPEAAIQDILGVDMSIINKIDGLGSAAKVYATHQSELDTMIRNLNDNLPGIMKQVKQVTGNSEVIFSRFVDAGYITKSQKKEIVTAMTNIEKELEGIQETVSNLVSVRNSGNFWAQIGGDVGAFLRIKGHFDALMESAEVLGEDKYKEILEAIGASHGIAEMLKGISGGKKSYLGTDMILTGSGGGKDIKVNISASLRMYQEGKSVLEDKLSEITLLKNAIESELFDCFKDEKTKVVNKINDLEQNPGMHRSLLRKHVYFSRLDKTVRKINVYEMFYPLENAGMETELTSLNESVERGLNYLEKYRKAIEAFFDKEDHIATLFDLAEGM